MTLPITKEIPFNLPPKGILEISNPDDPYPHYYHPLVGFLYRNRIKQALSLLKPPYESILEIGYGSGILMPTLVSIGHKVCGIDIQSDPVRIKSNLQKLGINPTLASGDILTANYPQESFDLAVAISVFEHIHYLEPVLKKVYSLLRLGGHFLVGMPRVDNSMKVFFSVLGCHNIDDYHVTNYKQFIKAADKLFHLARFMKMPSCGPVSLGLYFNMLFTKKAVSR